MNKTTHPATASSGEQAAAQPSHINVAVKDSSRKAFVFYSNWYSDCTQSLSETEQAQFLLVIVRYACEGILPDDTVPPILRTMLGLVRPAIDADLQKYDKIVETNRRRAEKRKMQAAEKNATRCVDNQRKSPEEPIINNQQSIISNQQSSSEIKEEEAHSQFFEAAGSAEASTVAGSTAAGADAVAGSSAAGAGAAGAGAPVQRSDAEPVVQRSEVEAYWRERAFKSDAREFFDYYAPRHWVSSRGERIHSWKKAAVMWEDKFRRDILPIRRREQAAEAAERKALQAAEREQIRTAMRHDREVEADRCAALAVTPQVAKRMYEEALRLSAGDEEQAIALLRRADDDPVLRSRLIQAS